MVDEAAVVAAVGEEMARILRSAHGAATDLKVKAAAESERVLADARARAAALEAVASDRLARIDAEVGGRLAAATSEGEVLVGQARAEAEAMVRGARDEASSEAARIITHARRSAESLRLQSEQQAQTTVAGAESIRDRILGDLDRRRRIAAAQIEQLRAGRARLLESYAVVRRTLEEVSDELHRTDSEARAAAAEVGRRLELDESIDGDDPLTIGDDLLDTEPDETRPQEAAAAESEGQPEPADGEAGAVAAASSAVVSDADADAPAEPGASDAAPTPQGATPRRCGRGASVELRCRDPPIQRRRIPPAATRRRARPARPRHDPAAQARPAG